jgi:N-acetylglucosaminyldiphosphoundecaprenol N-acetyl-beta-D-mannosaminyltransferase
LGEALNSARSELLPSSDAVEWSQVSEAFEEAASTPAASNEAAAPSLPDDLARDVYCILGMPIDAVGMATALARIETAAEGTAPYLISTPNLNFLVNCLSDPEFRDSLLLSDLSTADGMPIVWIARMLGIPIKSRLAGSSIFEALATRSSWKSGIGVFMFGGAEGVAEAAGRSLNDRAGSLSCVGSLYPGFGTLDDMSNSEVMTEINSSHAGFLVVALGAAKGQSWLLRNHDRINVPVRAHLGAVINFQAGTVKRAPSILQKTGLEWLWRIREEPRLWKRYWKDGTALLRLFATRILPLAIHAGMNKFSAEESQGLQISLRQDHSSVVLKLSGHATAAQIEVATSHFRDALAKATAQIVVDLDGVTAVDQRFLGLLLMMRKSCDRVGTILKVIRASRSVERYFRLNEVDYLLSAGNRGRSAVVRERRLPRPAPLADANEAETAQGLLH